MLHYYALHALGHAILSDILLYCILLLYHILLYCYAVSYYITLCSLTVYLLNHATSCYITYAILDYITPHYYILYHMTLDYITLYYTTGDITLNYIMLDYIMPGPGSGPNFLPVPTLEGGSGHSGGELPAHVEDRVASLARGVHPTSLGCCKSWGSEPAEASLPSISKEKS